MGAKLVGQVLAEWAPHLPPHLTLALVQLAHTARDDDDPPRYYAGIRPIARALGPRPNAADPDNAAEQAADRAVAQLVQRGAIRRVRHGGVKGRPAEYVLDLFGDHTPARSAGLLGAVHR